MEGGGDDPASFHDDTHVSCIMDHGSVRSAPVGNAGGLDHLGVVGIKHLPDVPELHRLVLPVGDEMVPVPLGRDARNPSLVSAETSHLDGSKTSGMFVAKYILGEKLIIVVIVVASVTHFYQVLM